MKNRISRKMDCAEYTKKLVTIVLDEYKLFYYTMLEKDKKEIFESCNKIKFYSCVSEYFEWKEDIEPKAVEALNDISYPLAELWQYYLSHEYIAASTWSDIDELLSSYADRLCTDTLSSNIQK